MKKVLLAAGLLVGLAGCGGGDTNNQPTATDSAMNGLYKVRLRGRQPVVADSSNNYHSSATHDEATADTVSKTVTVADTATRPLRASERAQLIKQLNKQRIALNATAVKLRKDTTWLRAQLALPSSAKEHARYEQLMLGQRQQAIKFLLARKGWRQNMAAFERGRRLLSFR
ncbi:hypothetical protein [Hymenobacter cheonanensis]|uniref:hypothetical protein n=1 Tax=Hymenobacter sp. CA2-7 TaxID=3063993 RepID=UPI002713169C|nr:hypothetical protein [Hymenobacter sp. CA2-7]MDO7884289.1 hypothetical protein [Hymenobacter sp. CA2-7]